MNLHAVVRRAITSVNPDTIGTWRKSTGYTTATTGKREQAYTDVTNAPLQVQALSGRELTQLDALNIQGASRGVWVNGQVTAANRADQTGGDLFLFDGKTWLAVHIFESWDRPGWSHCAVAQQKAAA